jgi:hypothetical protein
MAHGEGPPERTITMWGAPATGKTTFLAALSIALIRGNSEWRILGVDAASTEALIRMTTTLSSDRAFPPATVGIDHYRWALAGRSQSAVRRNRFGRPRQHDAQIETRLDIVDPSGDSAHPGALHRVQRDALVDSLVRSDAIVFVYDPTREFEVGDAFDHTFGVLVELARRMPGMPGGKLPHHVAVCITKFDEVRVLLTAERMGLLENDPEPPGFPRVSCDEARDLLATLCEVSASRTASTVLNVLERAFHPERIKYFPTSSVGFNTDARKGVFDPKDPQNVLLDNNGNRIRGAVRPINVAEPLLWLCERLATQANGNATRFNSTRS